MDKALLIVFVKNTELGKVKTRLAKTIGNKGALEVYKQLIAVTEEITSKVDVDTQIFFSEVIEEISWKNKKKTIQEGSNLGERMKNAFKIGFKKGYSRIVLIGSDLPDLTAHHINQGLEALNKREVVIGPAEDGGYYLLGLSKMHAFIFDEKPWSAPQLFKVTANQLNEKKIPFTTLDTLNDIDTFEDLIASKFYKTNVSLQEKIKQYHD